MLHVSRNYIGDSVLMQPRFPVSDFDEDQLPPRICAAPSIFKCLMGITGEYLEKTLKSLSGETLYLYSTSDNDYVEGTEVPDYFRTSEVFYTKSTRFDFVVKFKIVGEKIYLE